KKKKEEEEEREIEKKEIPQKEKKEKKPKLVKKSDRMDDKSCLKSGKVVCLLNKTDIRQNSKMKCPINGCLVFCRPSTLIKHTIREHWNEAIVVMACDKCEQAVKKPAKHDCRSAVSVKIQYLPGFDHNKAAPRDRWLNRLMKCPHCDFRSNAVTGPVRHMATCVECPRARFNCSDPFTQCIFLHCGDCGKSLKEMEEAVEHYGKKRHKSIKWSFTCKKK
ncbi:hypothetical protein PFISCL1PPCAC_10828, partial [Pristionchus fissidentatus]